MSEHFIAIQTTLLAVEDIIERVTRPTHGGIATFVGQVRNHHEGRAVTGITYEVYEPLSLAVFATICGEAAALSSDEVICAIVHFQGYLPIGGASIVTVASAAHRAEAFTACRYLIDQVKLRAPIWKHECYADGTSTWVEGNPLQPDRPL